MFKNLLISLMLLICAQAYSQQEGQGAVALGTLVSGLVAEVKVAPGQKVKKGDLLLRMDQRVLKAQEAAAKLAFERAKALFSEAKREEDRAKELYARTLLSDHELQLAEIERVKAESYMEEARAATVQSAVALEHAIMTAPFDGTVSEVRAYPGQMLNNRQVIQPVIWLVP